MIRDFYATLGVASAASAAEIKSAYRRLALQYHPDRHPHDPAKEGQFKEVAAAYEILGDPQKRAVYDLDRLKATTGTRPAAAAAGAASTTKAASARRAPGHHPTETTLRGRVTYVIASNTSWSAGRLRTEDGRTVLFAGALVVREHDPVVLEGSWTTHPRFGLQFKVTSFSFNQELDPAGLAHYLANHPDIVGIGPVKAEAIARAFGTDFDRVIDKEPERVATVARVSMDVVQALRTEWLRRRALGASLTWLGSHGLTHHQITKLIDKFGNNVVGILRSDPYLLVREIRGFGFRRVDVIAAKLGIPKEHPVRIRAGLLYVVSERLDAGDCWVGFEDLVERANHLLIMDVRDSRARIERGLDELVSAGDLACVSVGGRFLIANPAIYEKERDLVRFFSAGAAPNPHFLDVADPEALASMVAPELNSAQHRALVAALRYRLVLLCGAAGSGKSFTIAAIERLYRERGLDVILAAPTGKAAKRLEEVVGAEAFTIHRLLGFDGHSFGRGPTDPIEADCILLDETSMTDVVLAWHLVRALRPGTAVVLVGDHNQLPPVGPGNLLRDLIERKPIPTVILDEVVRQAGTLKDNSMAVLQGEVRPTAPAGPGGKPPPPWIVLNRYGDAMEVQAAILRLFERSITEKLGLDLLADVQLITPTHNGPIGTEALNIALQRLLQKRLWNVDTGPPPVAGTRSSRRPTLYVHDRVIQMRNNYDLGVMNGSIGRVSHVDRGGALVRVAFDDREVEYDAESAAELQLGYALTVHKVQGSQFPCAVVVVHKSHSFMHHQNLLYTGVTRAQKVVILVGDAWGMRQCALRTQVDERRTFLSVLDWPEQAAKETP